MPSLRAKRVFHFAAPCLTAVALVLAAGTARAGDPAAPSAAPTSSASPSTPPPDSVSADDPALGKPARPPPLWASEERPADRTLTWDRLLDVGGGFAIVERPATHDVSGHPSQVRYQPATGFELHLRVPLITYLQFEAYYVDSHHPVAIPRGQLGLGDTVTGPPVETFVFGARLSPKITAGRVTGWLTAGVGWGRFEFPRMVATTDGGQTYALRERGSSFVEFPFGFGMAWELVPRWLSIDVSVTASIVTDQHGEAMQGAQTVDENGSLRNVGPFPSVDVSLVQTIGFSLLL